MSVKHNYSISEFAEIARITRHALIHYEEFGLIAPAQRGMNNYRYYSRAQLATVNLIRTYQSLGMSLGEIKELISKRSPEHICESFANQIKRIDEEILNWQRSRKLLNVLKTTVSSAMEINESAISIQNLPEQSITLGEINDYSGGRDYYDALCGFYNYCAEVHPNINMSYPIWSMFSKEGVNEKKWEFPDRFYLNDPEGKDKKPKGLYAVGYQRGGYNQGEGLFKRILSFIEAKDYEVCGAAYEEYPLNEICVANENNYLIRIMINVRKKI